MQGYQKNFALLFVAVGAVLAVGTAGYMYIEEWNILDSFWMVVITLTTVGFGEIHPLSTHGRIWTLAILAVGMGVIVASASMVTSFVVEGQLQEILRRRKMRKSIGSMKNHSVICGAGKTGHYVINEMRQMKVPFVVIEGDHAKVESLRKEGVNVVQGDATHEEALLEAGVSRARRLITCLTDDRDNLFVIISARSLNPDMRIVSRYVDEKSGPKLKKAGADDVISPNAIGGLRMASVALRPAVVSFLDIMLRSAKGTLRVEEATVGAGSRMAGRTLAEARIPDQTGMLVVAIRDARGEYHFNPPAQTRLDAGLTLIIMGDVEGVKKVKALAGENQDK
jgi:voltage-gated potassium channel